MGVFNEFHSFNLQCTCKIIPWSNKNSRTANLLPAIDVNILPHIVFSQPQTFCFIPLILKVVGFSNGVISHTFLSYLEQSSFTGFTLLTIPLNFGPICNYSKGFVCYCLNNLYYLQLIMTVMNPIQVYLTTMTMSQTSSLMTQNYSTLLSMEVRTKCSADQY